MRDGWSIDSGPQAQEAVLRSPWEWASAALLFVLLAFSSYLKGDVSQVANPAVYDFLLVAVMGVHVMLRIRFPRELGWPVLFWGLLFFGYALGALDALFPHRSRDFILVMVYLVASFAFFAAVIYDDPKRRLPAIWWGYVVAAFIASAIGLAAYFGVMPDAARYLKFGRVTSLFNDPNVFGAFLVAPILFLAMRLSLARSLKELLLVPVLGVLVLAIFLCFSRGAWANLMLSGAIFMALAFVTSRSAVQRFRIVLVMLFAAAGAVLIVGWALSSDAVQDLFAQRFSLSQSYDVGADGRFDRQLNALAHGLRDPLGMGPAQWEQETGLAPHNVYLNILLAGGYLSLLAYLAFIGLTLARGTAAVFRSAGSAYQPYLIVTIAAVTGQAAESIIIDVDNWRHLYLLFGLAWGGIALEARERRQKYAEWEQQSMPRSGPAEGFYA